MLDATLHAGAEVGGLQCIEELHADCSVVCRPRRAMLEQSIDFPDCRMACRQAGANEREPQVSCPSVAKAFIPRKRPTSIAMLILEQIVDCAFLCNSDGVVLRKECRRGEVAKEEGWKQNH